MSSIICYTKPFSKSVNYVSTIQFDFTQPYHLLFELKNNYEEQEVWNKKNSGIGLENVKHRLKYLYKQGEYDLKIEKEAMVFTVYLKLKLK